MLSLCLVWCIFVALSDHFSKACAFWWSPNWSLNRSLTVLRTLFFPRHWLLLYKTVAAIPYSQVLHAADLATEALGLGFSEI